MKKSTSKDRHAEQLAHVRNVLGVVDPTNRFLEVAKTLASVIDSDSNAAEAFKKILQHISIKSLDETARQIYDRYLVLYKRTHDANPEPFGGPAGTADVLTIGYLQAQHLLVTSGARERLSSEGLRTRLADAATQVSAAIDGEFLADLLLESKTRASRDPGFARVIESGKAGLLGAWSQLTEPSVVAQQAGSGSACAGWLGIQPGSRACWVAGLVCVIIVVVAKVAK
jgi:hypothetical protein